MTKSELAALVAKQVGSTQTMAHDTISSIFEIIQNELVKGEEVSISGFGKFLVKESAPRKGVNPQTKEKIDIPAKNRVKFKASSRLLERI